MPFSLPNVAENTRHWQPEKKCPLFISAAILGVTCDSYKVPAIFCVSYGR